MVKVIIDVPDELEKKAKMLKLELSLLALKAFRDKIREVEKMEKIERFRKIVSKSKATEQDVEELSDEINTAMWEHHKKKYNL